MTRDLYNLYHKRTSYDLQKLRSKKYNRLQQLRSRRMGWFDLREADNLNNQIKQIDAEINARMDQLDQFS